MDEAVYVITLIGTGLVLVAAFSSLIAFRFGAPLLLVFLLIGLAAGIDGFGIDFDNAALAYFVGSLALAIILFDSGFRTSFSAFRQAALPAISLATIGVVLTAGFVGVAAWYLTDFTWLECFLLGSIVASTDAAAVFFLLRVGNISIRERVGATLEIESGSNDPIAIFLTLTLVSVVAAGEAVDGHALARDVFFGFILQMGLGAAAGLAGGRLVVWLVEKLALDRGLMPIFVLALSMMVFAAAGAIGGSGFLAVYLAGIVAGNARLPAAPRLMRFQDGMTWLAQIIMFLVLGLFATPSQFPVIFADAFLIGLFLIFIGRPLAVALCLIPFRFARNETAFVSWVGLRGAVSILLALTPLIGGLENGRAIFNIAFLIVLTSLVVQGWTVGTVARRLGLVLPPRLGPLEKMTLELPGAKNQELITYRVIEDSPVARGEHIPRWARPSLILRGGQALSFSDVGRLLPGDYVYIVVPDRYPPLLDRLFASRAKLDPADAEFFGHFALDPAGPASALAEAYGAHLDEEEKAMSLSGLVASRLVGRPEYGDRILLGPVELIVRDTDEEGRPAALGLSLDPKSQHESAMTMLSAGGLRDRIARLLARRPKKKAKTRPAGPDGASERPAVPAAATAAEASEGPPTGT
ncbi:potassium/proton antiporter [Afifella sp. IM 167]|uniref:potassium/proton antiporter n=1 Tax=Afifella sp. IM 167 TaxID=2033586 RepID=UPI001CCEE5FC|nr:potassium/proton antiporter [Afifella sp. IM 167]MBZ8133068.1 potassium/proton antiporter [Afifella sp. IM 167]